MDGFKEWLMGPGGMPHGVCYRWDPTLVALHVGSDLVIWLSYTVISATLAYLVWKSRKLIPLRALMLACGAFIILCSITHFIGAWTVFRPDFWLDGWFKLGTASVSVAVAGVFPFCAKRILHYASETRAEMDATIELERIEAQRRVHDRMEVLTGVIGDVVWTRGPTGFMPGGQIEWERYTGQKPEQYEGFGWLNAVHPDDRAHNMKVWQDAVVNPEPVRFDARVLGKDGLYRPFSVRAAPVIKNGKVVEWVGAHRDVSEEERVQEELHEALVQARTANKAKSDFLAVISHELRTPLTAVMGYAELIVDGVAGEASDGVKEFTERIQGSARHQLEMINQMLDFAVIEEGRIIVRPEVVNSAKIARACVDTLRPVAEGKGLKLVCNTPPGALLTTDSGKLRQIIFNLITNAIKFTERGSVTLDVRVSKGADSIAFVVTDTGCGIDDTDQNKIFEKFWQVRQGLTRTVGGAGLGLTIVKKLAQALGGDVYLESTVGKGSTFTVILPCHLPSETPPSTEKYDARPEP